MGHAQDNILDRYQESVEELLSRMTIEEKVGQMTQVTIDVVLVGEPYAPEEPVRIDRVKLERAIDQYQVGSILNTPSGILLDRQQWRNILEAIHARTNETRLKIPVLYGTDAIHGVNYCREATLFPQPFSVAATWNQELAYRIAEITAYESRGAGLPWNFSPALDVGRNPEWPRLWESFGEDVFVNKVMGAATVAGYQGLDPSQKTKIAACLKHYTGYGQPLSGKDRTPAWIPERYLREYYLPAYRAAIEAGALSVMVNSGEINGVPVHASKELLTDILRGELGFEGLVVSDWQDVIYLHTRHKIAPTMKDAVRMAVEAGLDMSMTPTTFEFADLLLELVKEGTISVERIDESVRRILGVKYALGLFDETLYPLSDYPDFGSEEHWEVSTQAAAEAMVLLKNEGDILPIPPQSKVLVTGPAATSMRALNGGWTGTWQGDIADTWLGKDHPTILQALEQKLGEDNVLYIEGSTWDQAVNVRAAAGLARSVDYVVLCLGETSYTEDAGNLNDLYMSPAQTLLAQEVADAGTPVILVLAEGRPRVINKLEPRMDAVIGAFLPGPRGGAALADLLVGDANFSGKLPFTYPRYPNSVVNYDRKHTEERDVMISGLSYNPQYEFGHGLSYTNFFYRNLQLSTETLGPDETLTVTVEVTNTGERAGKEAVLLYTSDLYASITPSMKRLRGFDKIELAAGETKTVSFELTPEDLAFVGRDDEWVTEPGDFKVMVGGLEKEFSYEE